MREDLHFVAAVEFFLLGKRRVHQVNERRHILNADSLSVVIEVIPEAFFSAQVECLMIA